MMILVRDLNNRVYEFDDLMNTSIISFRYLIIVEFIQILINSLKFK